jgi:hypothetical protein
MMTFAVMERVKGYGGAELISSQRELAREARIDSRTLRRDLAAMRDECWIEWQPGLSRRDQGDREARGARIRRLLPAGWVLAEVQRVFPGSKEAKG